MGFILVMSVVVLASFASELSNVGTEVQSVHSQAKIPDFINILDKFKQSVQKNLDNYLVSNPGDEKGINVSFKKAADFFYKHEIVGGTYFNASLIDCNYNGNTNFNNGVAMYVLDVNLSLNDGNVKIEKSTVIYVSIYI